jgi:hypothetical protein
VYNTRVNQQFEVLQDYMEREYHLQNPDSVMRLIYKVTRIPACLSYEQKQYVKCAIEAVENQQEWISNE